MKNILNYLDSISSLFYEIKNIAISQWDVEVADAKETCDRQAIRQRR
jgi:hypothetical protein